MKYESPRSMKRLFPKGFSPSICSVLLVAIALITASQVCLGSDSKSTPEVTKTDDGKQQPDGLYQQLIRDSGLCFPDRGKIESPNDYMLAVVESLSQVYIAKQTAEKALKNTKTSEWLGGYADARRHLGCGLSHLERYLKSPNDTISTSATGISGSLLKLAEQFEQDTKYIKSVLNGEADLRAGTVAEHQAQVGTAYKSAYEILVTSVSLTTYTMIDAKSHSLVITKKQKALILANLKKAFGRKLTKPSDYVETAAYSVVKVLNDKWKSADEK